MANILREAGPGFVAERPEWAGWRAPELAVVVPTFNERANVAAAGRAPRRLPGRPRLGGGVRRRRLAGRDGGGGARARPARPAGARPRRVGRRGLASACVEGMLATSAPLLAVMDADLQHDEALLPPMVARLRRGDVDLVVGSRYASGTAVPGWGEGGGG